MTERLKIYVKLLALHREKLPEGTIGNTCEIDIQTGSSVNDIMEMFDLDFDHTNVVLVNGTSPTTDQILEESDVVCVFSAIAGG